MFRKKYPTGSNVESLFTEEIYGYSFIKLRSLPTSAEKPFASCDRRVSKLTGDAQSHIIVYIYEGVLGTWCGHVNIPMGNHLADLNQRDS